MSKHICIEVITDPDEKKLVKKIKKYFKEKVTGGIYHSTHTTLIIDGQLLFYATIVYENPEPPDTE